MIKKTPDNIWFPFWVDKWIWGSMRIIWVDLLALAAKDNGYIRANEDIPYPLEQLAGILRYKIDDFKIAIEKFIEKEKITCDENGVLYVTNWEKYMFTDSYKRKIKERVRKGIYPPTKRIVTENVTPVTENVNHNITEHNITEHIKECSEKSPNAPKKKKPSKFKFSKKHLNLAKYLETEIEEENPKHTIRGKQYLEDWANTFRIMEEKKEASLEEIRIMIDFAMSDSFWHSNILSAGKLREQFGRLWEQAKEKGKVKSDLQTGQRSTKQTPEEAEYWKAREAKEQELKKQGLDEDEIQAKITDWSQNYWRTK